MSRGHDWVPRADWQRVADERDKALRLLDLLRGWAPSYEHTMVEFQEGVFVEVDRALDAYYERRADR